jgi:hypothetical protein
VERNRCFFSNAALWHALPDRDVVQVSAQSKNAFYPRQLGEVA